MQKDTIQRIGDPEYFFETLHALEHPDASFETVRKTIIARSRRRMDRESLIVRTGYGLKRRFEKTDKFTYWSNAQDSLAELMKIGLVVPSPLPSKRKHLDRLQRRKYKLTETGIAFLEKMNDEGESQMDMLLERMYNAHPYLRAFLSVLQQTDLMIPEYRLTGRFPQDANANMKAVLDDACTWLTSFRSDWTSTCFARESRNGYLATKEKETRD